MSRYVLTTEGYRVNLDRLAELRVEKIGGEGSDSSESRLFGIADRARRELDVEIVRGSTPAVEALWSRWGHYSRDGMDLARAIELLEAETRGITAGELRAGIDPAGQEAT